jgi:hypothetical protein
VGVFHALAISRGNSLLKSRWIQDFLEFYGRNLFKAESSATCGTSAPSEPSPAVLPLSLAKTCRFFNYFGAIESYCSGSG